MVSLLVLVRVATIGFLLRSSIFFGYPDGAVTELFNGTLKLRYSSTLFSRKFPSWPVSTLPGCLPVVGPGPGLSFHYPDLDPVVERPS